jgi:hypothetical protein
MSCHLEGLTPPLTGKKLPITRERPAIIKTNKGVDGVGEVIVGWVGDSVHLDNRSRIRCLVNGRELTTGVDLLDGDRITIGKQDFRLVWQAMLCTVCDQVFDVVDQAKGWSDGERRICRTCLAKGVRPANLASALPVPPDEVALAEGPPSAGDDDEATTEHVHPGKNAAKSNTETDQSDRQRRQRRLSASRLAQVDAPEQKSGLLSKVGQVFANREERKRLEALEIERRTLLEQAGRLALSENNGFGIPDHLYNPLLKGVQVSLRLQDFSIPTIEYWRSIRGRLTQLDAEIAALRGGLGLGADPGVSMPPQPLASVQRARQNEAFAIMDATATMELAGDDGEEPGHEEDTITSEPAAGMPLSKAPSGSSLPAGGAKSSGKTSGRRVPRRRR